jgi:hypothetical protein
LARFKAARRGHGIIALAFDEGYDAAVIPTKGTKSLTRQTVQRVKADFAPFLADDQVQVCDIMQLPELTGYEPAQKLIFGRQKRGRQHEAASSSV